MHKRRMHQKPTEDVAFPRSERRRHHAIVALALASPLVVDMAAAANSPTRIRTGQSRRTIGSILIAPSCPIQPPGPFSPRSPRRIVAEGVGTEADGARFKVGAGNCPARPIEVEAKTRVPGANGSVGKANASAGAATNNHTKLVEKLTERTGNRTNVRSGTAPREPRRGLLAPIPDR
jgi:hypothetical protein